MKKKVVSGMMLTVLLMGMLVGMLTFVFNVHRAEAVKPLVTEWTKIYGGNDNDGAYSLVQTSDGGYAIAGYTASFGAGNEDFWLVKVDSSGNHQWNKTYGGTSDDQAFSLVQTGDGGYAIAGYTSSYGAGSADFWLVKTDSVGTMQWNKTYGGTSGDTAYSLVQTGDGGYALAGYTSSFGAGYYDFWLVKVDSSGNHQWNRTYGGSNEDGAWSVVQTSDGGYALAGYTEPFGAGNKDFWLVKVDSSGSHQWNKTYGGANYEGAHSVIQTDDGGYALAGYTYSYGAGSFDFWLVKTDGSGNTQWSQTYGGGDMDWAFSVVQTNDGGYALAGYTSSFGAGYYDFWLVKVDSSGNHQWNGTYGGNNYDEAHSVVQTSDGGYALAGYTAIPEMTSDFMLVKVGPGSTRYPWPMFRHNPRHTGYTKSPAPNTNQTIWKYTTGLDVRSSPAVANGIVFVGSNDRKVYALDQYTGAQVWNFTTGSWVTSSPGVADGKVFVGSVDRKVYCLDAATGAHIWNFTTGLGVGSSPAVAYGKVYVGSYDGKVYCLDAITGAHIWNFTTGLDVGSSSAVANGKVYVGSYDGKVYCLDATTGAHIWNFTTGDFVDSSPAVAYGKVYVGSAYPEGGKVYCLDATTGAHIWNFTTRGWALSSPAVADGRVFVGSAYEIYCLDATTGAHVWNFTTGNFVDSSPAVADGKVYVGSYDKKVYCLNASTGAHIWSYTTGDWVLSSPAVADGMVFIGSNDDKVYAFGNVIRVPEDFPTVQEAINNATAGATIIIAPGIYYNQSMIINKTLTIIGLPGSAPIFDGGGSGIAITLLPGASGSTITGIVITNWDQGIFFVDSGDCKIYGNIMSVMGDSGIVLQGNNAANNRIYNNIFQGNNISIYLTESSTSNIIYHNNFINNTRQVYASPEVYVNIWDNGYPSGGNYWSDYNEKYPAAKEIDGSGIWDTPYIIDLNNRDMYPLVKPFRGIAITRATTSKTVIGQGFTLSINVTILNHGVDDEVSTVAIYANTTVKASLPATLTNRNFTTITFLWNTTGVAKGNYTITAKATPVPDETDTTDNTLTDGWVIVAMIADITGPEGYPDGKVDMRDVYLVARRFGIKPGHPLWNPNCDFNDDEKIDMRDIYVVARNFGKKDP